MWRDLATLWRDQDVPFKPPAGPSLAGQFQTRQDASQFVDGIRDAVRAAFPVMPSAIRDLKIFPRSLDRPAKLDPGVTQAFSKLGAGVRVMGACFPVL